MLLVALLAAVAAAGVVIQGPRANLGLPRGLGLPCAAPTALFVPSSPVVLVTQSAYMYVSPTTYPHSVYLGNASIMDGVGTPVCRLDGLGTHFFQVVSMSDGTAQAVKVTINTTGPSTIVSHFGLAENKFASVGSALLYNSLGTGYLVAATGIIGVDLFHFQTKNFFPLSGVRQAVMDLYNGWHNSVNTYVWAIADGGDGRSTALYCLNATATLSVPNALTTIAKKSGVSCDSFAVDSFSRLLYCYYQDANQKPVCSVRSIGSVQSPSIGPVLATLALPGSLIIPPVVVSGKSVYFVTDNGQDVSTITQADSKLASLGGSASINMIISGAEVSIDRESVLLYGADSGLTAQIYFLTP